MPRPREISRVIVVVLDGLRPDAIAASSPLVAIAALVGLSRVCLGVHYPGDVFAGQAIALTTGFVVLAIR
jgi:membrane-associated phospholipid phosphatase